MTTLGRIILDQQSLLEPECMDLKLLMTVNFSLPISPFKVNGNYYISSEVVEIIGRYPQDYEKLKLARQFYVECSRTHKARDIAERLNYFELRGLKAAELITLQSISAIYLGMEFMFVNGLSLVVEDIGITKGREEKTFYESFLMKHKKKHVEYSHEYSATRRQASYAIIDLAKRGKQMPSGLEAALKTLDAIGGSFVEIRELEKSSLIPSLSPRLFDSD